MNITFPASGQNVAAANDRVIERSATASGASANASTPVPVDVSTPASADAAISSVGSDAELLRSAEAALKSDPACDSRISEIKAAINAGAIRFDPDTLAAGILRYHGRQD
jgi:flagellar biosynthesis anti-sigma factor FlgM